MALSRSELKDIIKECILEVMIEGLKPTINESSRSSRETPARRPERAPSPLPVGKKHLDSVTFSAGASKIAEQAQGRRAPMPAIANLAAEFPREQQGVMQQIFEDTARNTLPSQMQAERSPGAAMAVRADSMSPVADVDPMSLFDGASSWADLAFAPSKKSM
jgi:hypothetical protein